MVAVCTLMTLMAVVQALGMNSKLSWVSSTPARSILTAGSIMQDERPFISAKRVLNDIGGQMAKDLELVSFHTVSKGVIGAPTWTSFVLCAAPCSSLPWMQKARGMQIAA